MAWTFPLRVMALAACLLLTPHVMATEIEERSAISNEVRRLLDARDFDALDAMAARYRDPSERTGSGSWKLETFYTGGVGVYLVNRPMKPGFWEARGEVVDAWLGDNPSSPTARLVAATWMYKRAWSFRGGSYAREVPEAAWRPFREHLRAAEDFLQESKDIAAVDPHWYALMLDIANELDWSDRRFRALLDEAIERHPGYYAIYFSAVRAKLPKWGGSAAQVDAFARAAIEHTADAEGTTLYSRIYWVAINSQFKEQFPRASRIDWPLMVESMDDVLRRYPSDWNIQAFAYFSCIAGDRDLTATLLSRMQEPPIMNFWKDKDTYTKCRAYSGVDGVAASL